MSHRDRSSEPDRVSTGHPEADRVLHGGFPAHSINVVMGMPGTGKTILAQQILFHNAGGERPVVYLSTLSEPLAKVLTFLQRFDFYDEPKMLDSLLYEDIGHEVLEKGAEHVADYVRDLIRRARPKLLVIDSLKAIHDMAASPLEMRRLCHRLGGILSAYDVTTFLVGEYTTDDVGTHPEFAVADGVVQLERRTSDKVDERYLRVLKLRGSAYEQGLHAFSITPAGLRVYPRLVTPAIPERYAPSLDRILTGVEGLDAVAGGGLWRGSTTLVEGSAGTGKTTIALGFALEGARRNEPSLFVNLQENPTQLEQIVGRLGSDVQESRARGLHFLYTSPVEVMIDSLIVDMFDIIQREGIRRLAIDGLTELTWAAASAERFHDYVYSMVQHFRVAGVTAMATVEASVPGFLQQRRYWTRLSALCDGLITLHHPAEIGTPERRLRIVKMRDSEHPLDMLPFVISDRGVRVSPEAES